MVVLFVASVLVVIADCKRISLHCSSFQSRALKDEILAVNCFLNAGFYYLSASFWRVSLSFKLSQDVMMFWNDYFPRFEDVVHPWSFRVKFALPLYEEVTLCSTTLLPHCEAVTWNCVFGAMNSIVSDLSTWLWWSYSQLIGSSKRCFVTSEFVAGFASIGYDCSVIGSWIKACDPHHSSSRVSEYSVLVVKAVLLHKASPSAISIGLSSLQCLSDSSVPFFALRLGMDLNEITGFSSLKTLSLSSLLYHVVLIYAHQSI